MSHETINKEDILFQMRRSRKAFLAEYVCGIILLIVFFLALARGEGRIFLFVSSILGLFSLGIAEYFRFERNYIITPSKMTIIDGIIKQHHKHIYFHPLGFVPDINVKQTWLQRFLNYGTISMQMSNETFKIKDVDRPHYIMKQIESLIQRNKMA